MKHVLFIVILTSLSLLLFTAGCDTDSDITIIIPPNPDDLVSEGWALFENGEYSKALSKFEEAIAEDEDLVEAHTGAGWCKIRLGQPSAAIPHFNNALGTTPTHDDALVGAVVACVLENSFSDAATHASAFLTAHGDSYVFSHDTTVSSRDVRILYALASYHIGDYGTAEAQVEFLDPTIDLDSSAPSYLAELLEAIESLMG